MSFAFDMGITVVGDNKGKSLSASCPPLDENGQRRIDPEGLQLLENCIATQPNTKVQNSHDGKYFPERKKLHDQIIAHFFEKKKCVRRDNPIAILTGGPPGSGKTTFLKNYAPWILSDQIYHIDADEVRAMIPEYKGWNGDSTHLETKDIVDELINRIGKPCRYDLIYDGTMNKSHRYIPIIQNLRKLGYKIYVIYITVPKEMSIERAMKRYQKSGRYVPIEAINEVFDNGLNAFEEVSALSDGYVLVDNSGKEPVIIDRGGEEIPKTRHYDFKNGSNSLKEIKAKKASGGGSEKESLPDDFDVTGITFN
jgi:predicted ABC-type ATPase